MDEAAQPQGEDRHSAVEGLDQGVPRRLPLRLGVGPAQVPHGPEQGSVAHPVELVPQPGQPRVPAVRPLGQLAADQDVGARHRRERVGHPAVVEHGLRVPDQRRRRVEGAPGHVRQSGPHPAVPYGDRDGTAGRALPFVDQDLDLRGTPGRGQGHDVLGAGQRDDQELAWAQGHVEHRPAPLVDRAVFAEAVQPCGGVAQFETGDGVRFGAGDLERDQLLRGPVGQPEHRRELPARRLRVADPGRVSGFDERAALPGPGPRAQGAGHGNRGPVVVGAVGLDVAHEVLPGVGREGRGRRAERHLLLLAVRQLGVLGEHDAGGQCGGHDVVAGGDLEPRRWCRGPAGEEDGSVAGAAALGRVDVADHLGPVGEVGLVEAQFDVDAQARAHGFSNFTRRNTGRTVTDLVRTSWSPSLASKS